MPKRKSDCAQSLSIGSFDAALDILACDTFTRLQQLKCAFEEAAGVKLNDGVASKRWEEAVRRYWVMKGMDDLCCSMQASASKDASEKAKEEDMDVSSEQAGRPLPSRVHPGAIVVHGLNAEEESEWRRWTPKVGDAVLVELPEDGMWPGKIIEKKVFFQGRTQPRGNHFFCVRIYDEGISPTVTIKSRLIPLHMRPNPPLLASTAILSAYNHATNSASFDMRASARESLAAQQRVHPGVGNDVDLAAVRAEKAKWNESVNWVMSERRVEKMRAVDDERAKRLKEVTKSHDVHEGVGQCENVGSKKRRTAGTIPLPVVDSPNGSVKSVSPAPGIFGPAATVVTPKKASSPSIAGYIRPALATPQRPHSPRRLEKRRSVYNGVGEYSPRGRGSTYTPPRILPSGDETAPFASSPAPTSSFDFVSPLGPVRLGRLESSGEMTRKGSLDVVKEEAQEDGGWTVVQGKRSKRAGSLPCREKTSGLEVKVESGMAVDVS